MNVRKISTPELVAAILCIAYTVLRMFRGFSYLSLMTGIYMFSFAIIGIGLLTGIYLISAIFLGIDAILEIIWFIQDIRWFSDWQYWVNDLTYIIAYVLLIVMMLPRITKSASADRNPMRAIWFVPGALGVIGYLPSFIYNPGAYFSADSILVLIWVLVLMASLFAIGYAVTLPAEFRRVAAPYAGYGQNVGQYTPNGQYAANSQYGQYSANGQYAQAGQTPAAGAYRAPAAPVTPAAQTNPAAPAAAKTVSPEAMELLRKYKGLLDAGIINQAEFDEQKKKILG